MLGTKTIGWLRAIGVISLFLTLYPRYALAQDAGASQDEMGGCRAHPMLGERLVFHGRWIGIPVGSGSIEVKEIVDLGGKKAYHIHGFGQTNEVLSTFYPIEDTLDSFLDVQTLQPLRFEKHQREGRYRADEAVNFDYTRHLAHYESGLNGSKKDIPIEDTVQDLISTFYWLRRQAVGPKSTQTVSIYTDEKIFHTDIQVGSMQSLELLGLGTFQALTVEPRASFKGILVKRGRVWAYVTADENHLPLLIKATTPWGPMSAVLDNASVESAQALWKNARNCAAGS